ncbi:MAG: cobalamin biosynthesis protein [Thermoprotei archaeon]
MVLLASFGADLLGEPPARIHPVVLVGRMAGYLDRHLRFGGNLRLMGVLLWATCVVPPVVVGALTLYLLYTLGVFIAWIVASVFVLKSSFTLFTMDRHVLPILRSLRGGKLEDARRFLQMIVRRPTSDLDTGLICSAAIESVAEGLVDGTCSPLLFYSLFGVLGALWYRAVNTLDSMVGYTSADYLEFGWFSARVDTMANYLGARLVGLLTVLAAHILGFDGSASWSLLQREHSNTPSVNAGYPIAAFAGALHVRLEKRSHYVIGEGYGYPNVRDVEDSLKLMKLVTLLFVVVVVLPVGALSVVWHPWWWL